MDVTMAAPVWARIIVGVLAAANVGFGIANYMKYKALFESSEAGVDVTGQGARFASYEFGARNLSIGIVLLLAACWGNPTAISISIFTRALVDVQSVIIVFIARKHGLGTVVSFVMLALEALVLKAVM